MATTLEPVETTEYENISDLVANMSAAGSRAHDVWSSAAVVILTALTTIGVAGVLSNIAVLAVLFKKTNRKLATNRYLINLAVSDILMSCFISILVIQRLYPVVWTPTTCRLNTVLHFLPLYLGINTIMLVAVERFVAITLPMHFRAFVTSRMVKLHLALAWLVTIIELIVPIIVVKVVHFGRFTHCTMYQRRSNIYYVFLSSVGLPSVFLVATYGFIVAVVVYRQHNSSVAPTPADASATAASTAQQVQAARRQKRALRVALTCAVVTLMFLVCWLPVWVIALMVSYKVSYVTIDMIMWTNMLNYMHAFINPVIYFTVDDRFRSVFVRIICRKQVPVDVTQTTSPT
ncbi:hypothetical protein NP493_981g00020 [Ridgeia piscesae]|uniref:G-protein coupled receptors family 1 profile domain-containing protein n=1 Tax=Ridgeia piscesae TaxID=27915 RepID=A0AAD9KK53_RIDPI|nr:hypothetical protein NP493_981g00020 [Ridgeia piscesae]